MKTLAFKLGFERKVGFSELEMKERSLREETTPTEAGKWVEKPVSYVNWNYFGYKWLKNQHAIAEVKKWKWTNSKAHKTVTGKGTASHDDKLDKWLENHQNSLLPPYLWFSQLVTFVLLGCLSPPGGEQDGSSPVSINSQVLVQGLKSCAKAQLRLRAHPIPTINCCEQKGGNLYEHRTC